MNPHACTCTMHSTYANRLRDISINNHTLAICNESGLTEGSIVNRDLTKERRGKGVSPSIDSDILLV